MDANVSSQPEPTHVAVTVPKIAMRVISVMANFANPKTAPWIVRADVAVTPLDAALLAKAVRWANAATTQIKPAIFAAPIANADRIAPIVPK